MTADAGAADDGGAGVAALTVLAPMAGVVRALADVLDPVFAQGMVGPGVAVDPTDGRVLAPVAGVVVAIRPHALVVRADGDVERDVLVHLGIDTVGLGGEGFELLVAEGDRVAAGAPVVDWDPCAVVDAGLSATCPVIALQAGAGSVRVLVPPGGAVAAGTPLLTWS